MLIVIRWSFNNPVKKWDVYFSWESAIIEVIAIDTDDPWGKLSSKDSYLLMSPSHDIVWVAVLFSLGGGVGITATCSDVRRFFVRDPFLSLF